MDPLERAAQRQLELVDENDNIYNAASPPRPLGLRASHVLMYDQYHQFHLQRTGPDHRNPDRIGSSVAGFVHRGESYLEAALRRSNEEVGITPELELLGTVRSGSDEDFKFSAVFVAPVDHIEVAMPGHVASIEVFTMEELADMLRESADRFTPTFPSVFALLRYFDEDQGYRT